MKRILLITDGFPYELTEKPFLLTELNELSKQFKIDIVARCKGKNDGKKDDYILSGNITYYKYIIEPVLKKEKISYLTKAIACKAWWLELCELFREKRALNYFKDAYDYLVRTLIFTDWLKKEVEIDSYDIIYTYWNSYATLALAIYKSKHKNTRLITRTHGYDLYNERAKGNRQCFKGYVNEYIDRIYFIANSGKEYYVNNFNEGIYEDDRLIVAPIGARAAGQIPPKMNSRLLLSCSRMIPLKRINLIVEALTKVDNNRIRWIHIGGGDEYDSIRQLCSEKLNIKENIEYKLLGEMSNEEVREFYDSNYVDCFISTSETEGSPVSMQEALAYGIPIIGTDVGEVAELIKDSGILLSCNPEINEIADAIRLIFSMDEDNILALRNNAYNKWKEYYDAENNAKIFVHMLEQLIEENVN